MMDPLTTIMSALVAGATAVLKDATASVLKDGYARLRQAILGKAPSVDLAQIEKDPASPERRQDLQTELAKSGVTKDAAIAALAREFVDQLAQSAPECFEAAGVDLERLRGGSLTIEDVVAAGAGVRVRGADIAGAINIRQVRAGGAGPGKA